TITLSTSHAYHLHFLPFSFTATATTDIYTLSLHDALPISSATGKRRHDAVVIRGRNKSCFAVSRVSLQTNFVFIGEFNRGSWRQDRKSTRLNSSHVKISYAVFCLKKKKKKKKKNNINNYIE